jgi:hypothetical protein
MTKWGLVRALLLGTLCVVSSLALGQSLRDQATEPRAFIPAGYVVVQEVQGDLNKDDQTDHVFVIKGTDEAMVIQHEYLGELDRNRRGIIIVFGEGERYRLVLDNRDCFSSENEDGGVYMAPELDISIQNGNLFIHYLHGRYGYWTYNFRYQNAGFELIGYEGSQNRGPLIEQQTSINFLTGKMVKRVNRNTDPVGGVDRFTETWSDIALAEPIRLIDIADFDQGLFSLEQLVSEGQRIQ